MFYRNLFAALCFIFFALGLGFHSPTPSGERSCAAPFPAQPCGNSGPTRPSPKDFTGGST